ncbi:MAG: CARDB domain-containing protein [bacterium]|nr:CARDB domain-containing protein [bacterium]
MPEENNKKPFDQHNEFNHEPEKWAPEPRTPETRGGAEGQREIRETENEVKHSAFKASLVAITITLLFVGALLVIIYSPRIIAAIRSGNLGDIFSRKESLIVSAEETTVASGEALTLSVDHKAKKESGFYTLTYPCEGNLTFEYVTSEGTELIPCSASFKFDLEKSGGKEQVRIVPLLENAQAITIPIYIDFTSESGTEIKSQATVSITGATTTTPVVTNTPATSTPPNPTPQTPRETSEPSTPVPYNPGKVNLRIANVQAGIIDKYTGSFSPATIFSTRDRIGIRFTVENNGGEASGTWNFRGNLPTYTNSVYESPTRGSLAPGNATEYTLVFEGIPSAASHNVVITIDPQNSINEQSEADNLAQVTLPMSSYIGKADLAVRITARGVIELSGAFRETSVVTLNDKIAVKFEVMNNGDKETGAWRFKATLPTSPNDSTYDSRTFITLAPSQKIDFTLTFDRVKNQGNNTVSIVVDPDNAVAEIDEGNNSLSTTIVAF